MENDIVLFRYADALLMKSEAKVRNGANGDVELNQVRSRVKAARRPATLENILSERQLELAWEGWRRQDLIRIQQPSSITKRGNRLYYRIPYSRENTGDEYKASTESGVLSGF